MRRRFIPNSFWHYCARLPCRHELSRCTLGRSFLISRRVISTSYYFRFPNVKCKNLSAICILNFRRRLIPTGERMKCWRRWRKQFSNRGSWMPPQSSCPKAGARERLGEVAENPRRSIQPDEIKSSMSYIGLEHMPRRSIALSEWESDTKLGSNKLEFKRGEILFGKLRPYFHKVGVAPLDGVCSTDILRRASQNAGVVQFYPRPRFQRRASEPH